jgi:hypothetical protein
MSMGRVLFGSWRRFLHTLNRASRLRRVTHAIRKDAIARRKVSYAATLPVRLSGIRSRLPTGKRCCSAAVGDIERRSDLGARHILPLNRMTDAVEMQHAHP